MTFLPGMLPPSGSCDSNGVDVNNSPWAGALDDFGIWDRVLTSEEIAACLWPGNRCLDVWTRKRATTTSTPTTRTASFQRLPAVSKRFSVGRRPEACVGVLQPDNACGQGTKASQTCIVANPSDTDFDGCVGMTDLLNLLSSFGTCFEDEAHGPAATRLNTKATTTRRAGLGAVLVCGEFEGGSYANGETLVSGLMVRCNCLER